MCGDISESESESVTRRDYPESLSRPQKEDLPSMWKDPSDLLGL